jgi:hypothetical protein
VRPILARAFSVVNIHVMRAPEALLPGSDFGFELLLCSDAPVHGEFVNYAAIGIWNRSRQWLCQA